MCIRDSSDAIVRTTHLTGLFTDLGIELSQLFFYRIKEQKDKLISTIKLRLRIIAFFFIGGIIGGVFYPYLELYILLLPASALIIGLYYDYVKSVSYTHLDVYKRQLSSQVIDLTS